MENVSPAKKVEAARAVCPPRRLRKADAVQQIMIEMINRITAMRVRDGACML